MYANQPIYSRYVEINVTNIVTNYFFFVCVSVCFLVINSFQSLEFIQ